MFWVKIYQTRYEIVVAACDEKLIDKVLKLEDLKVKVSKNFYGGNLVDETTAVKVMKRATIGNLIGKDIVKIAEENGFISKENIILIDGIPHAQFVKI
jgi:hypothetical protein